MSVNSILVISLVPLLVVLLMAILGRSTFGNLKILTAIIPLYAFGAVEVGFTIPPAYILLVLILIGVLLKGDVLKLTYPAGKAIVVFLSIGVVATAVAAIGGSGGYSVGLHERMGLRATSLRPVTQMALWIFHFSLFFVIANYVKNRGQADSILKVHLWAGFALMLAGLYQVLAFAFDLPLQDLTWSIGSKEAAGNIYGQVHTYSARVTNFAPRATFFESLDFANYLISVVPIAVGLWAAGSRKVRDKFGFVASPLFAIIGLTTIFFTMSRSGWLVMAFSLLIIGLSVSPRFFLIHIPLATIMLVGVTLLFAKLGFFSEGTGSLFSIIAHRLNMQDIVLDPRLRYLTLLWENFKAHPILGVGAGNFAILAPAMTGSTSLHSAHGLPWSALADFGLLGLMALTAIFFGVLIRLGRAMKKTAKDAGRPVMLGLFASISGLMLQALFLGDRPSFHLILLLGLAVAYMSEPGKTVPEATAG